MPDTPTGSNPALDQRRRSRTSLVVLALVAFVPLLIAYIIFFYFPALIPSGTTNEGALLNPPLRAEALGLTADGKWTLLLPAAPTCSEACEHKLYLARQVNVGLGKDADRVQRVLLVAGPTLESGLAGRLAEEYPEMLVVFGGERHGLAALEAVLPDRQLADAVFLMDPNGYVILYYRGEQVGKPMLKDLKHLLKISKIG